MAPAGFPVHSLGISDELGGKSRPRASEVRASVSALSNSLKGWCSLLMSLSCPLPLTATVPPAWPARPCEVTSSWLPGVWRHLPGILCGCQGPCLFTHWAYSWAWQQPGKNQSHCSPSELSTAHSKNLQKQGRDAFSEKNLTREPSGPLLGLPWALPTQCESYLPWRPSSLLSRSRLSLRQEDLPTSGYGLAAPL